MEIEASDDQTQINRWLPAFYNHTFTTAAAALRWGH